MESYEKRKLEELGFVNAMLERGVPADVATTVVKLASLDARGRANPALFEEGMVSEFSKNAGLVKRARKVTIIEDDPIASVAADAVDDDIETDDPDEEDWMSKLKRYGTYAGIGAAGMVAGHVLPKLYNSASDAFHRMRNANAGRTTNT